MKKLIIPILFFIMIIPMIVNAKTCDSNSITIQSIELENVIGNAEESGKASISGKKINLDLKLYDPGDSIEYHLVVKNTSHEDFYFDEDLLKTNTDYIEYRFSYDDNSNIIYAGKEKVVHLIVEYKNKVPSEELENDAYNDTNMVRLSLMNKEITNPETGTLFTLLLFLFVASIVLFAVTGSTKAKSYLLIIGVICIIPMSVYALCKYDIEVEAKIEIDGKEAYFLSGKEVNVKMKVLAGADSATTTVSTTEANITSIQYSNVEPDNSNKEDKNIVSLPDSPYPIYMWFDNGILYWWSEDKSPVLNENSSNMFCVLLELQDISGVANFDTSMVTSMLQMFAGKKATPMKIESIAPLAKWDVSNVTTMRAMFQREESLRSLEGLENWNTGNVETLYVTFGGCKSIESLEPLRNWNVSKVTDFTGTFGENQALQSLNGLENWDVSSGENFFTLFTAGSTEPITNLVDISALKNWDVSHVVNMTATFQNQYKLTNFDDLSEWNTESAESFENLFFGTATEKMDAIKNWNTSNVTNMGNMFKNCTNLIELDISSFDMSKIESTAKANIIPGCTNLKRLKTPKVYPTNSNVKINLPVTMYNDNGSYTKLDNTSPVETWLRVLN